MWTFNHHGIEVRVEARRNDRLGGQMLGRFVPRLFFDDAILDRLGQEFTDFLALQGGQLVVGIVPVELRAEIQGMNSWIVTFQNEVVLLAQKNIVFRHDLSIQGGLGNSQPFSGWTDDGAGFQQDHPIILPDVVGMDRDVVAWNFSSEHSHFDQMLPRMSFCCLRGSRMAKEPGGSPSPGAQHPTPWWRGTAVFGRQLLCSLSDPKTSITAKTYLGTGTRA